MHERVGEILYDQPMSNRSSVERCHGETLRAISHRYTTVHLNRDGARVPFVRLSGRWLGAFGFKEGAKFAAVGSRV